MSSRRPRIGLPLILVVVAMNSGPVRAERILHKEITVAAPVASIWHAWTTEEGLRFISSKSRVELRPGGPYEWFLDLEPDPKGKRGGEGARVLSYVPLQVLSFTWTFPPSIPSLRDADETTAVVVQFDALDDGTTHVLFDQVGWQDGEDWDRGYEYFDSAWTFVLDALKKSLEDGP